MPNREHPDLIALDELYRLAPSAPSSPAWYRRAWAWIKDDLFREVIENHQEDSAVVRRIRVHERATVGARRLHKLNREEAREILLVTAQLLGFDLSRPAPRRVGEGRR